MIPTPERRRKNAATPGGFPRKRGRPSGPSDASANLDPRAHFVENCRVAVMTRHYFIVARDQASLCEYLTRQFAAEENVEVFLDRRSPHDRRKPLERSLAGANGKVVVDRRATDRRQQPFVDSQLRSLGYAMLRAD